MSSPRGLLLILVCLVLCAEAADWPQYRGPNLDGSSPEKIRTDWNTNPPAVLWRKTLGPGWSSMTVAGGRVLTQARIDNSAGAREYCVALNAERGAQIWAVDVGSAVYTDLAGYSDQLDGPRSTPTIDGDRVYVLTSYLQLHCLRADNGALIWKRDFMAEWGANIIPWENAASPLVVGDLIYLNSNARSQTNCLTAIRKSDGGTEWSGQQNGLTHASPVYGTIDGVPQVIFLCADGLVSVSPLTGAPLWKLGFFPSSTSTASSPVIVGNSVWASAAYGSGMWIARVSSANGVFTATQGPTQRGVNYQSHWSTPVEAGGFLYCVPSSNPTQQRLSCLDMETGVNRWTTAVVGGAQIGYGSVIKAKDDLIVLTETGELVAVSPTPTGYVELGKTKILNQYCWNHVALADGIIYARNSAFSSEIVAIDVKLAAQLTNSAPVLGSLQDRSVAESTPLAFTASATDVDLPAQTLTYALDNPPAGAAISAETGAFLWTPSEGQGPGTYAITVRVSDNGSPALSATNSFTVTVTEVNLAPSIVPPVDQIVEELSSFSAFFQASDADVPTNALSFFIVDAPPGVTVNASSGAVNWTPSAAQGPGSYAIKVGVSDDGSPVLSATNTFNVSVTEINIPAVGLLARFADNPALIRISVRSQTATPLEQAHLDRLEVVRANEVDSAVWESVAATFIFAEGTLVVELPIENVSGRYLRVREKRAVTP